VSVHQATTSPFSVYLKNQQRVSEKAGVAFQSEPLQSGTTKADLARRLEELGRRTDVDAVLMEHPLPTELDFSGAIERLPLSKDVDGVSSGNLGRLVAGRPVHVPAVALAAREILRYYGVRTRGKRVAVIGRSPTVGLPMVLLLAQRGEFGDASVVLLHSQTPNLAESLAGAEVIISCAGRPGLLRRSVVPQGSVVIDVGLSTVPDPSRSSGVRSVGDADAGELDGWVQSLSPVPGGVGPVTVAELMGNVVGAWKLNHGGGPS
jgi:methylenetetrahydrofolate dehydrogenase (NADP+)/methenyltetrahydrofolate cyclohydrolase